MTAATAAPTAAPRAVGRYHVSFPHMVRSEWIKIRTLRSTWWTLGSTVALMVLMSVGMAVSVNAGGDGDSSPNGLYLVFGFLFAQLTVAVLGALTITGEFSTGMIRSTLAASPTRVPALIAKTLVTAVAIGVTSLVAIVISYVVTLPILSGKGVTVDLASSDVTTPILACIGYLVLVAIMSVAVGTLLRHSAGAIFTLVGVLFVANLAFSFIQADWGQTMLEYTPMQLGIAAMDPTSGDGMLPAAAAWLALLAWAFVPFTAALLVFKKRDA